MDAKVMELRIRKWMPIFEEQARSGIGKKAWCEQNGIRICEFYKRQRECREYLLRQDNNPEAAFETTAIAPSFVEIPAVHESSISHSPVEERREYPGHIDVSCGKFRISITGEVNESVLARLIREVGHARQ